MADHMTKKSEAKGSKTLMGMSQLHPTSKASTGSDSGSSVSKLGGTTKGNPNS